MSAVTVQSPLSVGVLGELVRVTIEHAEERGSDALGIPLSWFRGALVDAALAADLISPASASPGAGVNQDTVPPLTTGSPSREAGPSDREPAKSTTSTPIPSAAPGSVEAGSSATPGSCSEEAGKGGPYAEAPDGGLVPACRPSSPASPLEHPDNSDEGRT